MDLKSLPNEYHSFFFDALRSLFLLIDDEDLCELSRKPDVMLCIEHALNDPQDNESTLWKLAGSFKKLDGLHIDVEMFRARGTDANPTLHLMEHVIARFDPTIKDLIDHLKNIDRLDICDVIIKYLEGKGTNNSNPLVF